MALSVYDCESFPHHEVTMVDVNQRTKFIKKNKKRNRIENVEVKESDGLSQVEDNTYDFVLLIHRLEQERKLYII